MLIIGETVGLAEWIIDDTCLLFVVASRKILELSIYFHMSCALLLFTAIYVSILNVERTRLCLAKHKLLNSLERQKLL